VTFPTHETGAPSVARRTTAAELLGRAEAELEPALLGTSTEAPEAEPVEAESAPDEAAPVAWRPASFPLERRAVRRAWRWFLPVGQLGALAVLAYLCLFNLSIVRGSSMAPRIHDGDRILIDHFSYLWGNVRRGDIVVLKYPLDPSVDYIKRVIGLPGDEVVVDVDGVYVNGTRIQEPYVEEQDPFSRVQVQVKPAHFFVLGDNRPRSCDSREFGLVPQDYIRGKVEVRVWPPSRMGPIDA
jgi:signal peptidase I